MPAAGSLRSAPVGNAAREARREPHEFASRGDAHRSIGREAAGRTGAKFE
jgi:hypothetical protein